MRAAELIDAVRAELGDDWIPSIYRDRIRTQRTRSQVIAVPERENAADIQYTLLGIELKVGRRRFACPDLATARYLRVFARVGCGAFAVPYDITRISPAADDLEVSWQRMLLLFERNTQGGPARSSAQLRARLVRAVRGELNEIGPGDTMPAFDRETRQRKR